MKMDYTIIVAVLGGVYLIVKGIELNEKRKERIKEYCRIKIEMHTYRAKDELAKNDIKEAHIQFFEIEKLLKKGKLSIDDFPDAKKIKEKLGRR